MRSLSGGGFVALLLSLCVHNERPRFLNQMKLSKHYTNEAVDMIMELRNGLDILAALWGRNGKKRK